MKAEEETRSSRQPYRLRMRSLVVFPPNGGIKAESEAERRDTAASSHAVTAQLNEWQATIALNLPAASLHGKKP